MVTSIVPNLLFGPDHSFLPPPGNLLLITDHLDSPAEFIIHRILAAHLKEIKDAQAVILSFALEFSRWRAIAAKSNVNLSQYQSSSSLTYIYGLNLSAYKPGVSNHEAVAETSSPFAAQIGDQGLRTLYFTIDKSLPPQDVLVSDAHKEAARRTVIIDDISLLELIGVPSIDLTRFIRALRALCRSRFASLIIRAHALPPSETGNSFDSDLLRFLVESCHAHVEVRPLASGRSGAVSGEIAVHQGGLSSDDAFSAMGRKTLVQYRMSDAGVVFFQKGMGAGVL